MIMQNDIPVPGPARILVGKWKEHNEEHNKPTLDLISAISNKLRVGAKVS